MLSVSLLTPIDTNHISKILFNGHTYVSSYEARITYKCSYAVIRSAKRIVTSISGNGMRNQSTAVNPNPVERRESSWRSYVRIWQWKIPIGLGFSFLAVLQWRYFRKRNETDKGPIEGLMVTIRLH